MTNTNPDSWNTLTDRQRVARLVEIYPMYDVDPVEWGRILAELGADPADVDRVWSLYLAGRLAP